MIDTGKGDKKGYETVNKSRSPWLSWLTTRMPPTLFISQCLRSKLIRHVIISIKFNKDEIGCLRGRIRTRALLDAHIKCDNSLLTDCIMIPWTQSFPHPLSFFCTVNLRLCRSFFDRIINLRWMNAIHYDWNNTKRAIEQSIIGYDHNICRCGSILF